MAPPTIAPLYYMLLQPMTSIFRFALLAPAIMYWRFARSHNKLVAGNTLLHNGTYNAAIGPAERFADQAGLFVLVWGFVGWLVALLLPPPLNLPILGVDIALTVFLSRPTSYQSRFVPKATKACNDMSTFYNERPPGTNESFFAAAARLNATATTPARMCKDFVQEWQYGVALSFFFALLSVMGTVIMIGTWRFAKQQSAMVYVACKITVVWTCATLIYLPIFLLYLPVYLFRGCVPVKAQAPVRTARRYTVKTALGAEQKTEIALEHVKTELFTKTMMQRYKGAQGEPTPLAQFLGIYDMLTTVIPHLHFVDVISLASVSKSVRNAVLPPDDLYRRMGVFRRLTCTTASRMPCWVCSTQVCSDCYELASVDQTAAIHHLENCVPYCMSCFYNHVAVKRPQRGERLHNRACKCAPSTTDPSSLYMRLLSIGFPSKTVRNLPRLARPVCRACLTLTAEEVASRKTKSAKATLKRGYHAGGQKWDTCGRDHCDNPLGIGPRFWVCTTLGCGKECMSLLHDAWGRGGKGAEDAV